MVPLSISLKWITAIYWLRSVLAPCPQCDASFSASATLPATIVTSSMPTSVAGHMMYPSPHTVMYASTPALADGGLAVLNAFSQAAPTMQVSHAQAQDTGALSENVHKACLCRYPHLWGSRRTALLLFSFFSAGAVPQVFLTAPPGTVQIPVSAVQLHPVRQDLHFTSETLIFSTPLAWQVTTPMHPNRALAHVGWGGGGVWGPGQ